MARLNFQYSPTLFLTWALKLQSLLFVFEKYNSFREAILFTMEANWTDGWVVGWAEVLRPSTWTRGYSKRVRGDGERTGKTRATIFTFAGTTQILNTWGFQLFPRSHWVMGEQTEPLQPVLPAGRRGGGGVLEHISRFSVSLTLLSLPILSIGPYIDLQAARVAKLHDAVMIHYHHPPSPSLSVGSNNKNYKSKGSGSKSNICLLM